MSFHKIGKAPQESTESSPLCWFVGGHRYFPLGLMFCTVQGGFSLALVSGDAPLRGSVDDGL